MLSDLVQLSGTQQSRTLCRKSHASTLVSDLMKAFTPFDLSKFLGLMDIPPDVNSGPALFCHFTNI